MAAPITDSGKLPPELFSHLMFPRIIIHQPCLFVLFFIPERHRFCKCIRGIKEVSSQDRIAHNFVFLSLQKGPSELHRHQLRKVIRACHLSSFAASYILKLPARNIRFPELSAILQEHQVPHQCFKQIAAFYIDHTDPAEPPRPHRRQRPVFCLFLSRRIVIIV